MRSIVSRFIAKLVYPDGLCCIMCEKELTDGASLCSDCAPSKIKYFCARCGNALANELPPYCDKCVTINNAILFDEARAPYCYADERAKRIVWKLKYGEAPFVAEVMAKPMTAVLSEQFWQIDLITYVPLHPKKERKRTYNQSRLLAEYISEQTGIPLVDALRKTIYNRVSATKLGREERIKMLSGSFAVSDADIRGKSILLVDDVMTSKATANECAKTLKFGKAKRVYVLTYATARGDEQKLY